jgi:hypothetical protein
MTGPQTRGAMERPRRRQAIGWIAVGLSVVITCVWAFWGIIENYHEGWYYGSLLPNLALMFAQYLSPMLVFMGVALASISRPRIGAVLHVVLALAVAWFFQASANTVILFLIAPLVGIGALYWFGRPRPRKLALLLAIGLPLLTLTLAGVGPALRASRRVDDGNLAARTVQGNGVTLVWAPDGPGWPREGTDWYAAQQACQQLSEDGLALASAPQQTWRLPTVEEAVRSMALHGQNSGGVWDAAAAKATYEKAPDKESPLWNVHSQVIYWWTATEADAEHAYIIVYDGKVWPRTKEFGPAYLGFRCVKRP